MTSVANARPSFGERYTVERELGRGGMATVYLCTDTKFGRPVAIKLLHPDLAAAVGAERFHREIKIATALTHPNILPAYDSGEAEGSLYYVMPFVEGESLRDRITREKQLPVDDTVKIITEVANALQHAHAHGIVHRDIKPENILLEAGVAVVADFGIARAITNASDAEALTQTGVSIGTPTYMSPEQAVGEKGVDGRSDQYSLACVMYEMLAGQPPFVAGTLQGIIMKHVSEPVPLLTTVRPSVPDELEDCILRALEKVPADRFPTIGDFAAALNQVVAHTGTWTRRTAARTAQIRATRRHPVTSAPTPVPATRRSRMIGLGVIGAAIIGVGTWAAFSYQRPAPSTDPLAREIAVMYFDDASGAGALRAIADGISESVIEHLASVPVLHVRSRNAVLPYRNSAIAVDSVARALGVGTVVHGSLDPTSAGARVSVRLLDASGDVIERRSFAFDSSSALTIADSVAGQIALFLRARLGPEVALRELRSATRNTDAWTYTLRADRRIADGDSLVIAGATAPALIALHEADSLLALAERTDSKWTRPITLRAAAALSSARALRGDPAGLARAIDTGLAHVDRALALDQRSADAWEYRGRLLFQRYNARVVANPTEHERTLNLADSALRRATQINPFQAGAWDELSALSYRRGDLGAVIQAATRAYESDAYLKNARSILNRLFLAHYSNEANTEAMKWLNEFRRRFPNDPLGVEGRLWMYRTNFGGVDIDSAWAYQRQYVALTPPAGRELARRRSEMNVAGALAKAGLADSARQVLLRARPSDPSVDPGRALFAIEAAVRVMLGDKDVAVERLKEYVAVNPDHRLGFSSRAIWWWRDLQNYPPFQSFIAGH